MERGLFARAQGLIPQRGRRPSRHGRPRRTFRNRRAGGNRALVPSGVLSVRYPFGGRAAVRPARRNRRSRRVLAMRPFGRRPRDRGVLRRYEIRSSDSAFFFSPCATGAPACSRNGSSHKRTKEPDADRKRCAPFSFGNQGDSRTSQQNFANLRMMSSAHTRNRVSRWQMAGGEFAERGIDRDPGRPYSGAGREDTCRGVGPYLRFQRVYPFSGMARVGRRRLVHSTGGCTGWTDGGGHRFRRTGRVEHGSVKVN